MVKDKEVGEDEVARAEKQLDAATKKHTDADRRCPQAQGSRAARGLGMMLDREPTGARTGRRNRTAVPGATCRQAIGDRRRPRRVRRAQLVFCRRRSSLLVAVALVLASVELHEALKQQGMNVGNRADRDRQRRASRSAPTWRAARNR